MRFEAAAWSAPLEPAILRVIESEGVVLTGTHGSILRNAYS